jgi:hypothetical protein
VKWLQTYGRPVICTGFLARDQGSTVQAILPVALKYNVGALLGDLVAGKTQKWLPWDSWQNPFVDRQPATWAQDIFRSTGPLYEPDEADVIRKMIAMAPKPVTTKPGKKSSR